MQSLPVGHMERLYEKTPRCAMRLGQSTRSSHLPRSRPAPRRRAVSDIRRISEGRATDPAAIQGRKEPQTALSRRLSPSRFGKLSGHSMITLPKGDDMRRVLSRNRPLHRTRAPSRVPPQRPSMRARHRASRAASLVIDIELAFSIMLFALCFAPVLLGMQTFVVSSASMTPAIPQGSIAYTRAVRDVASLAEGDVIAFSLDDGGQTVLHRIASIDAKRHFFTTKGDANSSIDPAPVPRESIKGLCVASIPLVGSIVWWINTHAVASAALLVALNIPLAALAYNPCACKKTNSSHSRRYPKVSYRKGSSV